MECVFVCVISVYTVGSVGSMVVCSALLLCECVTDAPLAMLCFVVIVVDHAAKASFLLFKENYGDCSRKDV